METNTVIAPNHILIQTPTNFKLMHILNLLPMFSTKNDHKFKTSIKMKRQVATIGEPK